jgi:hypothetical protein
MSISQLFPEEGPTLNLNFAGSRTLDPRITFTRTSTGTYMGPDGLIKVAPADAPRFDHRYVNGEIESLGLLVEEQRQNLLTGSEDFGPSYWVPLNSVSTSLNSIVSPDGNTTADKFIENTNTTHKVLARNFTLTASTTYTYSLFVKSAERNALMIHVRKSDYSDRFGASFNLSTQVATTETSGLGVLNSTDIKKYPNDWYRISITGNIGTNTSAVVTMYLIGSGSAFDIGYTGDGTSGIYVWGAQLERGNFPTSYIPTTTNQTATRTPDNASMTGSNFSSWYNQTEGTIISNYSTFRPIGGNQTDFAIMSPEVSPLDRIVGWQNVNQIPLFSVIQNNTSNFVVGKNEAYINRLVKKALAIKTNNMIISVDGDLYTSDLASGAPDVLPTTFNRILFGYEGIFASYLNGHIRQFIYYPTRLPNSHLQALTR